MNEAGFVINFTLKHADPADTISSTAKGSIDIDNFEEMAQEIARWFTRPYTTCEITDVSLVKETNQKATYKYKCMVCGKPNNYWWMYCQEHEAQCDREMDEADDPS